MKRFVLFFALGLASLTACGGDDDGGGSGGSSGSGGSATGGSGGSATGGSAGSGGSATGGAAGSGGSATGGAAGSGGSATGGAAGSGGSASGGTGGSSTGGTGGSSTGGTGGTSACNSLVNDGADVPETAETGTPPTMTGGSIADGTYVLTARKDWQGSCNCTTRQKLSITGTAVQVVTRTDAGADQRFGGTLSIAGKAATLNVTCPGAQTKALEYTATATELQLFDPADQSLQVYAKK